MLNEQALRKPTWQEGHWAELADGQKWAFPRPRVRFKAVYVDGKIDVGGGPTFGPEFDDSIDILLGVKPSEPYERLRVKFEMAVRLFRSNYEVTDDQIPDLFVLESGDPVSEERFEAMTNIIMGLSPKRQADTSDALL